MNPEELMAQVNKRAKDIFKSGLNCAEGVQEALLHQVHKGLPTDYMALVTGCGGGGDNWGFQPFQEMVEGLN